MHPQIQPLTLNIGNITPLKMGATLITGAIGSGKSTLGEIVQKFLAKLGTIVALDTSACIEESKKRKTVTGLALDQLSQMKDAGLLLPAELVLASIFENIALIKPVPFHVIIMGSPRTPNETKFLLQLAASGKLDFRVLVIEATEDEMRVGIADRIAKGKMRADQGETELAQRLDEFENKTIPAIEALPRGLKARTTRSTPLLERMETLVNLMNLRKAYQRKLLNRLGDKGHPARIEIDRIHAADPLFRKPAVLDRHLVPPAIIPDTPQKYHQNDRVLVPA